MTELFGVSMTTIMIVLLAALGICVLAVAAVAVMNPTMMRMGLRNIPRRRAESVLVVLGLMLSTLIITAAFTVGDSLDYSITRDVYDILRPIDETIEFQGGAAETEAATYVPISAVVALEQRFADDPDIDGFIPAIVERVPVFNPGTKQSEPRMTLTGVDPERIAQHGGLRFTDGRPVDLAAMAPGTVLLNPKSAEILDAKPGDTIQILVNNRVETFTVAGIVRPELLTGWTSGEPGVRNTGGVTMPLAHAQALLGRPDAINFLGVSNTGGVRDGVKRSDAVEAKLSAVLDDSAAREALGLGGVAVHVDKSKQDGVNLAETFGNILTTFFIVLGLFSIAAGVLLIFMIFVMLAAERKTEMGMARAIGLKRRNLIQTFISEGMAYTLAAGLVGVALGVLAAYLLVVVAFNLLIGDAFGMALRVTPRSLVISYALGAVLTFITVAVSSWRVSKLNIVAAIRDVPEGRARRAGRASLVWGIIGVVVSLLALVQGQATDSAFLFSFGATVIVLSGALVLRFFGAPQRAVFTAAGALIFLYWSLPDQWSRTLFGDLNGDIEMFFLSGMGMVIGSTLVLMYNASVLINLFQGGRGRGVWLVPLALAAASGALFAAGIALDGRAGDISQLLYMAGGLTLLIFAVALVGNRAQRFAPALKMAIAYPLANRFRTGMTIAMFSLIVFSITVMSTLTDMFAELFVADEARAGWDITAIVNRNNPLPDFRAALIDAGFSHPDDLRAIGRSTFPSRDHEARVAGAEEWKDYPVVTADEEFYRTIAAPMKSRARGYDSDEAVWRAVSTQPGVAVVDGMVLQNSGFGADPNAFTLAGRIKADDMSFDPVPIEVRDPVSGRTAPLTVIGVVDSRVSQSVVWGIYVSPATYQTVFGAPQMNRVFIELAPGVDPKTTNRAIKAALVTRGVESFDLRAELREQQRLQIGFNQIFQGFMALGLFVGVAALGVIAFRSVVERRQQIGMLRAIGYQRGTVALSFILESGFISVMGVIAGIVGASILSRNLIHSDAITTTDGIAFAIPWWTVIGFLVAGFGFALLMTWWPARRAASLPIAEALRYE